MVNSYVKRIYVCQCDNCRVVEEVEKNKKIYNGAQAVRSLGWSFGNGGREILCGRCRGDNYRFAKRKW